ncbi:MAG: serine hydrolase [Pyrinomonadaceae bacterium]
MNWSKRAAWCLLLIVSACASATAQPQKRRTIEIVPPRSYAAIKLEASPALQKLLDEAVRQVIASYPDGKFKPEEIAATLIDLGDPAAARWAHVRGEQRIYPASVVKMFYMAALERQLEDGKIAMTKELERGLRDMIVVSSNEATQYILDVLTDTSSGAELPKNEFDRWQHQRNRVNRFYSAMGYTNINVNQKTFCEDAYGIEQQSRNYKGENRNMLTTNATARLLAEIVTGRMNTPERTKTMMDLMSRDWTAPSSDPDDQAVGFTGKALIDNKLAGAKLWSKAGWTSRSRHDAAYIETPDGLKFVLVVFTENHANDREPIPAVAARVIAGLRAAGK